MGEFHSKDIHSTDKQSLTMPKPLDHPDLIVTTPAIAQFQNHIHSSHIKRFEGKLIFLYTKGDDVMVWTSDALGRDKQTLRRPY